MKKVEVKMKKPIYLGLSILEISKIIMHVFWYDYVKKKYEDMVKLCYMDTDSLIMNIKTKDFYKDIAQDVEERFDTSNYDVDRPLYFKVPKDVKLNSTHFFIMKIPNKRELQQIALNHSSDIDFKDFMNIYKKCTTEPYSFLVNDTTLPSDDPLGFRKNLFG